MRINNTLKTIVSEIANKKSLKVWDVDGVATVGAHMADGAHLLGDLKKCDEITIAKGFLYYRGLGLSVREAIENFNISEVKNSI